MAEYTKEELEVAENIKEEKKELDLLEYRKNKHQEQKTLNEVLIDNLRKVKKTREDIHNSSSPNIKNSEVLIPVPNILVEDQDPMTRTFLKNLGKLNRDTHFEITAEIKKGQPVTLQDGRKTFILELIFKINDDTDVDKIEEFLEAHSE